MRNNNMSKKLYTAEDKALAYELFLNGDTKAEIARTFSVSPRTIGRWIAELESVVVELVDEGCELVVEDEFEYELEDEFEDEFEYEVEAEETEVEYYVLASRKSISISKIEVETGALLDSVVVDKDSPNFNSIFTLIASSNFDQKILGQAYAMCNPKLMLESFSLGRLQVDIDKEQITYTPERGSPYLVSSRLSGRVISTIREKGVKGADAVLQFLNRLMSNPSSRAVEELYGFLEHNDIEISPNGNFYAWKVVRDTYMDKHSNTMLNAVGMRVEMPRNQVNEDSSQTCSYGLHVCAKHYIKSFSNTSDRVIKVEVDPADVVAIPKDYNDSKMRCAGYDVIEDVTKLFLIE